MERLEGKVAVVTGGAQGLGEAIVREFVNQGAQVVIGDILEKEGLALEKELEGKAKFIKLDVSDEENWKSLINQVDQDMGSVDILVNNAGIVKYVNIEEMEADTYRNIVNVNQVGTFLGMKNVVPSMKKVENGRIINISSVEGLRALPGGAAYESTKFAVRGMTKSAAIDLAQYNIRVNSVHPGAILTPMLKEQLAEGDQEAFYAGVPLSRGGEPVEYAKTIAFLASDESSYATGAEFVLDGGMTALL